MQRIRERDILDWLFCLYGFSLAALFGLVLFNQISSGDFVWRHARWQTHLGNLNLFLSISLGIFLMAGACSKRLSYPLLALLSAGVMAGSVAAMHFWEPILLLKSEGVSFIIGILAVFVIFFLPALLFFMRRWRQAR